MNELANKTKNIYQKIRICQENVVISAYKLITKGEAEHPL
jgi:hypothetical protein